MSERALRILAVHILLVFAIWNTSSFAAQKFEHYLCDPREPTIRVYFNKTNKFNTLVIGSEVFMLKRVSHEKLRQRFSVILGKNLWQIRNEKGHVSVQKNGIPRLNCSSRLGPKSSQSDYEKTTGYISTGAKVYDGPSFNNSIVDQISKGIPVYLRERAGGIANSLEWFEIEYADRKSGYIWGKNICSNSVSISGINGICEN